MAARSIQGIVFFIFLAIFFSFLSLNTSALTVEHISEFDTGDLCTSVTYQFNITAGTNDVFLHLKGDGTINPTRIPTLEKKSVTIISNPSCVGTESNTTLVLTTGTQEYNIPLHTYVTLTGIPAHVIINRTTSDLSLIYILLLILIAAVMLGLLLKYYQEQRSRIITRTIIETKTEKISNPETLAAIKQLREEIKQTQHQLGHAHEKLTQNNLQGNHALHEARAREQHLIAQIKKLENQIIAAREKAQNEQKKYVERTVQKATVKPITPKDQADEKKEKLGDLCNKTGDYKIPLLILLLVLGLFLIGILGFGVSYFLTENQDDGLTTNMTVIEILPPTIQVINASDYHQKPCETIRYDLFINPNGNHYTIGVEKYADTTRLSTLEIDKPQRFAYTFIPECNEYGDLTSTLLLTSDDKTVYRYEFPFTVEPNGIPSIAADIKRIRTTKTRSLARIPITNLGLKHSYQLHVAEPKFVQALNSTITLGAGESSNLNILIDPPSEGTYTLTLVATNQQGNEYEKEIALKVGTFSPTQIFFEDNPLALILFIVFILFTIFIVAIIARRWTAGSFNRRKRFEEWRRERFLRKEVKREQKERKAFEQEKLRLEKEAHAHAALEAKARSNLNEVDGKELAREQERMKREQNREKRNRSYLYQAVLADFLKEYAIIPKNKNDKPYYLWKLIGILIITAITIGAFSHLIILYLWAIVDGLILAGIITLGHYGYTRQSQQRAKSLYVQELGLVRDQVREDLEEKFYIIPKQQLGCCAYSTKTIVLYWGILIVLAIISGLILYFVQSTIVQIISISITTLYVLIGIVITNHKKKSCYEHIIGNVLTLEQVRIILPFTKGIGELLITFKKSMRNLTANCMIHKHAQTFIEPQGEVFQYFTFRTNGSIAKARMRYKIPIHWCQKNHVNPKDIRLNRYQNGKWISTNTSIVNQEKDWIYFETEHAGDGQFAITGKSTIPPTVEIKKEVIIAPRIESASTKTKQTRKQKEEIVAPIDLFTQETGIGENDLEYSIGKTSDKTSEKKTRETRKPRDKNALKKIFVTIILLFLLFLGSYGVYYFKDTIIHTLGTGTPTKTKDTGLEAIQQEIRSVTTGTNNSIPATVPESPKPIEPTGPATATTPFEKVEAQSAGIPPVKFVSGSSVTIDLDTFFTDPDEEILKYSNTPLQHVVVSYAENIANISSPISWSGTENTVFIAKDPLGATAESNSVSITVLPNGVFAGANAKTVIYWIAGVLVLLAVLLLGIAFYRFNTKKEEDGKEEE